jgi:hypothetical protein
MKENPMTPQEALTRITNLIDASKVAAADGLSVGEFSELAMNVVRTGVQLIDAIPVAGPEKKEWVLQAVGVLFDAVADKMVPMYLYPVWLLVRPGIRIIVLAAAGGAIESILPVVRAVK